MTRILRKRSITFDRFHVIILMIGKSCLSDEKDSQRMESYEECKSDFSIAYPDFAIWAEYDCSHSDVYVIWSVDWKKIRHHVDYNPTFFGRSTCRFYECF